MEELQKKLNEVLQMVEKNEEEWEDMNKIFTMQKSQISLNMKEQQSSVKDRSLSQVDLVKAHEKLLDKVDKMIENIDQTARLLKESQKDSECVPQEIYKVELLEDDDILDVEPKDQNCVIVISDDEMESSTSLQKSALIKKSKKRSKTISSKEVIGHDVGQLKRKVARSQCMNLSDLIEESTSSIRDTINHNLEKGTSKDANNNLLKENKESSCKNTSTKVIPTNETFMEQPKQDEQKSINDVTYAIINPEESITKVKMDATFCTSKDVAQQDWIIDSQSKKLIEVTQLSTQNDVPLKKANNRVVKDLNATINSNCKTSAAKVSKQPLLKENVEKEKVKDLGIPRIQTRNNGSGTRNQTVSKELDKANNNKVINNAKVKMNKSSSKCSTPASLKGRSVQDLKKNAEYNLEAIRSGDLTDNERNINKKPSPPLWSVPCYHHMHVNRQNRIPMEIVDNYFLLKPLNLVLTEIFPTINPNY